MRLRSLLSAEVPCFANCLNFRPKNVGIFVSKSLRRYLRFSVRLDEPVVVLVVVVVIVLEGLHSLIPEVVPAFIDVELDS